MKIKLDSGRRKWQIIAAESLMNTRLHVCCFPAGERIQPNTIYGGIICVPRAKSFNNKHNSTFKNETQDISQTYTVHINLKILKTLYTVASEQLHKQR